MKREEKISPRQFVFLMLTCILSTVDVFVPNQAAQYAGRDAWISALAAGLIGYTIYRVVIMLGLLFPGHSLAGFSRLLLGKYLGGLVTIIYIAGFLTVCVAVMVQFAVIMPIAFKPESSIYLWDLLILIPALYIASLGISVPARMNELLLPVGLLILILVVSLNIPEIDLKKYLPVFENGYLPPAKVTVVIGANLAYSVAIVSLLPLIENKGRLPGLGLPSFIVVSLALLLGTASIAIFGPDLTAMFLFPALQMTRNIDIGFLTRLDAFMMMVWYTGFLIFMTVFSYGAASLTKDLFGLKDYRLVLWLYGVVIMVGADFRITNIPTIMMLLNVPLSILLYALGLAIPLLLYMVARIRGYPGRT